MAKKKKKKKKSATKASTPTQTPANTPAPPPKVEETPLLQVNSSQLSLKISEVVFLRTIFILVGLALLGYVFYELRTVLTPIFIALLLAYLINPLVDRMEGSGASRNFAISMLVITITFTLVMSTVLLIPPLSSSVDQLGEFLRKIPDYLVMGKKWVQATFSIDLPDTWLGALKKWSSAIQAYAPKTFKPVSLLVSRVFASSLSLLLALFHVLLVPLFAFYFLKDFHSLKKNIYTHVPPRYEEFVRTRLARMNVMISGFVRGQMIVSLIVGTMYMILLVVMEVPFAPVIAIVGALINVVPYLGFATTFAITIVAVLVKMQSITQLAIVVIGMGGIHMVDVFMITPKVVGDKVGMSELMVIVAVLCGGQLFGFLGVLLAVPTAAVLKVILEDVLRKYHDSPFFTGETAGE
jgi:predicted PurR-regulated permease PerM